MAASIDLEYHNIDPARDLFFGVTGKRCGMEQQRPTLWWDTRSTQYASRSCLATFSELRFSVSDQLGLIACDSRDFLVMGDPFQTYNEEVVAFWPSRGLLATPLPTSSFDCRLQRSLMLVRRVNRHLEKKY